MVSFIHSSDWQIGMKGSGLGKAAILVREARIGSIDNVLKVAKERSVDFVILAGDTFENSSISTEEVNKVVALFNKYREIPIYLLPGNHDLAGPGSIYNRDVFQKVPNLTVMNGNDPIEAPGALLHACPVSWKFSVQDATRSIPSVKDIDGIHIGIAHGSLVGKFSVPNWEEVDLPIDLSVVDRTGIDYLALGHWHGYRIFDDSFGIPRIAYSGTHEQTNYEETDAGYCLHVTIDKKGAVPLIEPIKIGQLTWASLTIQMDGSSSLEKLKRLLKDNEPINLVKLELSGELPLDSMKELEDLLNFQETLHKNFKVQSKRLAVSQPTQTDLPFDFRDPILDQVDKRLIEMLSSEKDSHQREIITRALLHLRKRGGEELQ
jgi:DNA repair exonuclease SbcCD nuclease subunit